MAVYVTHGDSTKLIVVASSDETLILLERGCKFPRLVAHCEWDGTITIDELLEDKS